MKTPMMLKSHVSQATASEHFLSQPPLNLIVVRVSLLYLTYMYLEGCDVWRESHVCPKCFVRLAFFLGFVVCLLVCLFLAALGSQSRPLYMPEERPSPPLTFCFEMDSHCVAQTGLELSLWCRP